MAKQSGEGVGRRQGGARKLNKNRDKQILYSFTFNKESFAHIMEDGDDNDDINFVPIFGRGPELPDENDWEGNDMIPLAELLDQAREVFNREQLEELFREQEGEIALGNSSTQQESEDQDNGDDDTSQKPDWSLLPDVVLSHLFRKLSDKHIGISSRVCKSWHKTLDDPALWRVRNVKFGSACIDGRYAKSLIGFARSHGQHVHKLRIQCPHPTYSVAKRFTSAMTSYLHILNVKKADGKRCELKEIAVNQLFVERYWRYENLRSRMMKTFTRFLKKQRRLVFCDFSEDMLSAAEGLEILDSIGESSGRTIRVLNIEDFFATHTAIYGIPRFRLVLSSFHNLRSLITNYNYLNNDIIELIAKNCERNLKCLSIKVYRLDPYQHEIHSYSWKMLRRACPMLRVCLYFEAISSYSDIHRIACHEIPLKVVQIWTGIGTPDENWQLDDSIRYLGNTFQKTLEEVCFYLENATEEIDSGLLHLLEKAKHLESLDLQATINISTVETICEWQKQYKIGLERCHIAADNLTQGEEERLEAVVDKYRSMLDFRSLDFQLLANPRF